MKYFLSLFFLLYSFFVITPLFAQSGETQTGTELNTINSSAPSSSSSGIFSLLDKKETEKLKVSEIQSNIDFETDFQEKNLLEQESHKALLGKLNTFIQTYNLSSTGAIIVPPESEEEFKDFFTDFFLLFPDQSEPEPSVRTLQENYQKFLLLLEQKLTETQKLFEESENKTQDYESQLEIQKSELEKTQISVERLIKDWLKKGGYFLGIIFTILIFSWAGNRFVYKNANFPDEKKQIIVSLIHLIRNICIIGSIIVFFFSEFLTFLPALAILGTAIGFALRDVISSFIAWFVIGLRDTTFKVGDVIEIPRDQIFGEVVKIHPLVTTIKELGLSGPNGKFRSFPNKLIFETSLNNLWKYGGWTFIPIECMITYESDTQEVKKLLLESMNEVYFSPDFSHSTDSKTRLKKLGIPEKNQVPQIFIDVRTQGIFVRGKLLVMWNERHEIRNRIVETFAQKVKNSKKVELRYVDFWINDLR